MSRKNKNYHSLVGMRFTKLKVLKEVDERKHGSRQYLCKCDCGKEKIVIGFDLKSGLKSCGCFRKSEFLGENQIGKIFGKLKVVGFNKIERKWTCKCECGNITYVRNSYLVRGLTKSCGCLRRGIPTIKENNNEKYVVDLKGKKIGLWKVGDKSKKKYSDGKGYWNVQCECGLKKVVETANLKNLHSLGCVKCRCNGSYRNTKQFYK